MKDPDLDKCICQAYPWPNPLLHNRKCPFYLVYTQRLEEKARPSANALGGAMN